MKVKLYISFFMTIFSIICYAIDEGPNFPPKIVNKPQDKKDYIAKDFSYLLGKMDGFNDQLLSMHFQLYKGYIKNLNSYNQALIKLREEGKEKTIEYGALKKQFGFEFDGVFLHEYYFENLGGLKSLDKGDPLYQKIIQDFGSFENFTNDFKETGLIRGIGWVITYLDPNTSRLYNVWINEHQVNHLVTGVPLLVMDVWEHAYLTAYGLHRDQYIDNFLKNINWKIVSNRYQNGKSNEQKPHTSSSL